MFKFRKRKVLTDEEKAEREQIFFNRCSFAYALGTMALLLFAITLALGFVIISTALILHYTLTGYLTYVPVTLFILSIIFELVGFLGSAVYKYYEIYRRISEQNAIAVYIKRLIKAVESKSTASSLKGRTGLFNSGINYLFIRHSILSLINNKLVKQEKLALIEFGENIKRFNELVIIADKQTSDILLPYLKKLVLAIINFSITPNQFLKDYYYLKIAYERRAIYLKQFKNSELYDINKKRERYRWAIEKIAIPLLISLVILSVIALLVVLGIRIPFSV